MTKLCDCWQEQASGHKRDWWNKSIDSYDQIVLTPISQAKAAANPRHVVKIICSSENIVRKSTISIDASCLPH